MLIETTQARAHSSTETFDRFWTVQTVANMSQKLCAEDIPVWSVIEIPEAVWASHTLPSNVIPSFEVCNIKRTYELELRLGLKLGSGKVRSQCPSSFAFCILLTFYLLDSDHFSRIPLSRQYHGDAIPRDLVIVTFFSAELAKFTTNAESGLSWEES